MTKKGFKNLIGDTMKNKLHLQKKLSQNKIGAINIWTIIAILIIGLLVWQFGAEYLGFSSITDYLEDYDNPNEQINFSYTLKDPISHSEIYILNSWVFDSISGNPMPPLSNPDLPIKRYLVEEGQVFPYFEFTTNAPYSLNSPYYCRVYVTHITYKFNSDNDPFNYINVDSTSGISGEYAISHLADILTETYTIDLSGLVKDDLWKTDVQSNFLQIFFYNSNGSVMFEEEILLTKEWKA